MALNQKRLGNPQKVSPTEIKSHKNKIKKFSVGFPILWAKLFFLIRNKIKKFSVGFLFLWAKLLFLLSLVFLCWRCEKERPAPLVAEYRDLKITLSDFARTYFYYWQTTSLPDSPALRRQFAQQLIEQELIAQQGKVAGLDRETSLQKKLKRDTNYFARRRYLEVKLKDTIAAPTEAEIDRALARQNLRLRVRELFATDKNEIQKLAARVNAGEDFAKIAQETIPNSAIADRGGDLGWLGWGETDWPVEEVLYNLQVGQISPPVQSLMGWHIFRLDSMQTTLRVGDHSPLQREDARLKIINRRFDVAAAQHLRELVWSKKLVVDMRVLQRVWDYLAPALAADHPQKLLSNLNRAQENPPLELSKEVAATVDGQPFTVQEFLEALPELPRALLRPNLKKALEVAIRDKLLTEKALAEGFGHDPAVKEKARRTEVQYVYYATLAARRSTVDTLQQLNKLHHFLLPKDYDMKKIRFNEENLKHALARRGTIF